MIRIEDATDTDSIAVVRDLLREYRQSLGIDLCFQDFDAELEGLPGNYLRPDGCNLLARVDGVVAGCGALRRLMDGLCEMKRLYVKAEFRGLGVGRLLAVHLIGEARKIGYDRNYLDTLPSMAKAQLLYEQLGFKEIAAYCHNPIAGARYLGLDLKSQSE